MSQMVIDELIVKLRLDAEEYDRAEKQTDAVVEKTAAKRRKRTKERNSDFKKWLDQSKKKKKGAEDESRWNERVEKSYKRVRDAVKPYALAVTGIVSTVAGAAIPLANMYAGLRRMSAGTGEGTREMLAFGSASRRLGADADAGAQALADLAREQKAFHLTGSGPTMMALQQAGVQVGPGRKLPDIIADLQKRYRAAAPGQQQELETRLVAQGVSPEIVAMMKSPRDAAEVFARSMQEAAVENRTALDNVTEALASFKARVIEAASALIEVVGPAITAFGDWMHEAGGYIHEFSARVQEAGGGLRGFFTVLDQDVPRVSASLRFLGEVLDVVLYGYQELAKVLGAAYDAINKWASKLFDMPDAGKSLGDSIKGWWNDLVGRARQEGPNVAGGAIGDKPAFPSGAAGAPATVAPSVAPAPVPRAPAAVPASGNVPAGNEQRAMQYLMTKYGLSLPQAAGVVSNSVHESGLNPAAFNPAGGGQGAQGAFQWRGDRIKEFETRFKKPLRSATLEEQLDFLMTEEGAGGYERRQRERALAAGGGAGGVGYAFSRDVERHANAGENLRRQATAEQIAKRYEAETQINVQQVTVQANNPQELAQGLKRQTGVTSYNSAVR
ncbi:hypothetical protein 30B_00044 [Ralstonia phage Jenny]|uniref:Phage tail lysozyme domain-containing protein n=1 Tax=Ralstonia phage Jenny TaxID=2759714 RepID=A0A7G5BB78_9CAUD|nr:hypothetical protein 30B_00044 [Ralstonia phage Jenny]